METIDIIELLKRAKEGKAPKKIKIGKNKHFFNENGDIEYLYCFDEDSRIYYWLEANEISVDTPIEILDKPIIEELHKTYDLNSLAELRAFIEEVEYKLNEIIRYINKGSGIE